MHKHNCVQCAWVVWTFHKVNCALVCSLRCARSWEQIRVLNGQRVGHAGRVGSNRTWSTRSSSIFLPGELQTRLNDVRHCAQCASRLCGPQPSSNPTGQYPTRLHEVCSMACLTSWEGTQALMGAAVRRDSRPWAETAHSDEPYVKAPSLGVDFSMPRVMKYSTKLRAVYRRGTHPVGTEGCGICADEDLQCPRLVLG